MTMKKSTRMQRPTTHIVSGIFVGTGIEQQPHAVHVTSFSGPHQRRRSVLRVGFAAAHKVGRISKGKGDINKGGRYKISIAV